MPVARQLHLRFPSGKPRKPRKKKTAEKKKARKKVTVRQLYLRFPKTSGITRKVEFQELSAKIKGRTFLG